MVVRGDEGQAIGEEKESCNWVGEEKVSLPRFKRHVDDQFGVAGSQWVEEWSF